MPDIQYASLQQRQAEVEQKLAAISEQFAADHPEVASLKRTLETIHRQLDDRRGGILSGLKTKVDSYKARVDEIEQELERAKRRDSDAATRYREYFNGKHELENYRRIRDGVQARIFEETINSVLARSTSSRPETTPAKP
jgi:chromosome segregation ATPase